MLFIFNKIKEQASIILATQMIQYEVCRVRHSKSSIGGLVAVDLLRRSLSSF